MGMIDRLTRAYQALGQKQLTGSPLTDYYPNLRYREHVTAGKTTTGGAEIDRYIAHAQIYRQYAWIRRAISAITTAISPLPRIVVDSNAQPVENHPLTLLLKQPNVTHDSAEFTEILLIHKLLGGEWFAEVVEDARGNPAELWPRRPDEVWVVGAVLDSAYAIPAFYQVPLLNPPVIDARSMIHEMFVNPLNPWRGLSVIRAVGSEIANDLASLANTQRTLTDGVRDYAISTDQTLTPAERARAEMQLDQKYGRHRPLLLEAGQDIRVIGKAPDDVSMLAVRDYSRQAVGAVFGVPDEIMGYGKDTYENFNTALRVFWTMTLLPMTQRLDATFTHFFTSVRPMLRPGERVMTDTSSVRVLQDDVAPRIEQGQRLWAMGVPYNTIEQTLKLGTGPIPGGEVGYLPATLLPASMLVGADIAAPEPVQRSVVKRAPNPRLTALRLQRIRQRVANDLESDISEVFDQLARDVVRRARAVATTSRAATTMQKASVDGVTVDALLPLDEEYGLLTEITLGVVQLMQESWQIWNLALGVDLAFEETDPAVVAAMRQSSSRVTAITETTRDALRKYLEYGAEQGWSITELVEGDDTYPNGLSGIVEQTYRNRSRAIARTEMGFAQAEGTVNRYQRAGVSMVEILDNGFDDSHPECVRLNGTTQTLDWYRANPLQHPNCVRAAAPIID